ncbi:MAG: hypothetical protein ACLUES_05695 [Flavonifractor plautii]
MILAYGADRAEERALFTRLVERNAHNMSFRSHRVRFVAEGSWRPPWERRWPSGEASDRKRRPRAPLQFQALRRAVPGPLEGRPAMRP